MSLNSEKQTAETRQPLSDHHLAKGILLSLLVWFIFTIMAAIAKNAQNTANIPQLLLVQNLIGVIFTLPYVIRYHFKQFSQTHFRLIFIRSVAGQLNFGFLLLAINTISLANSMLLNNTAPLIVPLIAWLWLNNKIEIKIWPGVIVGFLGVLLILKPNQQIYNLGALYAMVAALCLSVVMISLRLLSTKEHPMTVIFYFFLTGLIISAPLSFLTWHPLDAGTFMKLISIGLLMSAGQYLLVKSFYYGAPSQLAPLSYTAVVYSIFFDWLLWQHIPDFISMIGMVAVCIGGILTILLTRSVRLEI